MPKQISAPVKKHTVSKLTLPDKPVPGATRVEQIKALIVSPPGWGKTEFALSNPDLLLLACEEGHKFTGGNKIIIDSWDGTEPWVDRDDIRHGSFVDTVELLQVETKFPMVGIDTFDMLIKMLLDFTYGKKKIEHATDLGDYGKGWDIAQNAPFRKEMNKLLKTGRGIIATTHEQTENKQFKGAGTRAKKETTLPAGIYRQIFGQFDLILHGWFGKRIKGRKLRQRIFQSEGSTDMLAKNRGGFVPPAWIVNEKLEERWKEFAGFFSSKTKRDASFEAFEEAGYELE